MPTQDNILRESKAKKLGVCPLDFSYRKEVTDRDFGIFIGLCTRPHYLSNDITIFSYIPWLNFPGENMTVMLAY